MSSTWVYHVGVCSYLKCWGKPSVPIANRSGAFSWNAVTQKMTFWISDGSCQGAVLKGLLSPNGHNFWTVVTLMASKASQCAIYFQTLLQLCSSMHMFKNGDLCRRTANDYGTLSFGVQTVPGDRVIIARCFPLSTTLRICMTWQKQGADPMLQNITPTRFMFPKGE